MTEQPDDPAADEARRYAGTGPEEILADPLWDEVRAAIVEAQTGVIRPPELSGRVTAVLLAHAPRWIKLVGADHYTDAILDGLGGRELGPLAGAVMAGVKRAARQS
jgi:hypothetical protein